MTEHPLSLFAYCPKCGSPRFEIHNEKSKRCPDCGFVYYFNPSSATVAFIVNERNELLVCRRAKDPSKGTLDLPGGFVDMHETAEEVPNLYLYSGFTVHTLDMFFRCQVEDTLHFLAMDDAADTFFVPFAKLHPEEFGLTSIRKGLEKFLKEYV